MQCAGLCGKSLDLKILDNVNKYFAGTLESSDFLPTKKIVKSFQKKIYIWSPNIFSYDNNVERFESTV